MSPEDDTHSKSAREAVKNDVGQDSVRCKSKIGSFTGINIYWLHLRREDVTKERTDTHKKRHKGATKVQEEDQ